MSFLEQESPNCPFPAFRLLAGGRRSRSRHSCGLALGAHARVGQTAARPAFVPPNPDGHFYLPHGWKPRGVLQLRDACAGKILGYSYRGSVLPMDSRALAGIDQLVSRPKRKTRLDRVPPQLPLADLEIAGGSAATSSIAVLGLGHLFLHAAQQIPQSIGSHPFNSQYFMDFMTNNDDSIGFIAEADGGNVSLIV
jgi:hypothetical protein